MADKVLAQYHEATGYERALKAMERSLRAMLAGLDRTPLYDWGRYRWFEGLIPAFYLYEKTGESWLLDLARKLRSQGFDYAEFYRSEDITVPRPRLGLWKWAKHVVNTGMAPKAAALSWRLDQRPEDRAFATRMIEILNRYHGQVTGMFTGDECLAGKNPLQGTELCSAPEIDWPGALTSAVAKVVRDDETAMTRLKGVPGKGPSLSADSRRALLRHLCRRSCCGDASRPEDFLLPAWLTEVAFLLRRLTEIGSWARFFHTIVSLHREGEAAPEAREQTLAQLLARVEAGEALKFIPEVVVYLEGEVRARQRGEAFSGPLPPPLEPDVFFPGQELDAVLLLMQEALEFLSVRGSRPHLQQRQAWLREHRELVV